MHRRDGCPHVGQVAGPTSNEGWRSDMFVIACWSGEVVLLFFAIECHDHGVPNCVASPRPLTGADVAPHGPNAPGALWRGDR